MNNLKDNPLLLVGNQKEEQYFKNFFKEVELVKSNSEALSKYNRNSFFTIFLNGDSEQDNAFEICKQIRQKDRETVIALLANSLDKNKLEKAVPLHLSGFIKRPFKKNQVADILSNVKHDLEFLSTSIIRLKDNYHFCTNHQILYDSLNNEVKLTKNELKLLNILLKVKNELTTEEHIEHKIWEDDFFEKDCTNRLKNLLYNLRKKLPKDSISNNYKLGYKLIYS